MLLFMLITDIESILTQVIRNSSYRLITSEKTQKSARHHFLPLCDGQGLTARQNFFSVMIQQNGKESEYITQIAIGGVILVEICKKLKFF